jgi:hypothetical protein
MISKKNMLISLLSLVSMIVLNITTPLFINSFQNDKELYFVLLYSNIVSILLYPFAYLIFNKKKFCISCNDHKKILFIGFLWSICVISIMYVSATTRVPPDIQAIIVQLFFPLTFIFNILFGIKYKKEEFIIFFIICFGLIICIIPIIIDSQSNIISNFNIICIIVFTIGILFHVLANIFQNKYVNNIDSLDILFYGRIYQLLFSILLIWINIIKGIGYDSFYDWSLAFMDNFNCYFYSCDNWYIGLINVLSANIGMITQIYLINNVNSSFIAILCAIASPLSIIIWYFIETTSLYRLLLELFGMIFIVYGFIKYSYILKQDKEEIV